MRRSQSEDLTEHGHLVLLDLFEDFGDLPSVHFAKATCDRNQPINSPSDACSF